MELRYITVKNQLVSENFWNDLLLIASTILFQLILGTLKNITPPLDGVDEGETVSDFRAIKFLHFCFSLHRDQKYLLHNSLLYLIVSLYFGGFYYWISAYCWKIRS